MYVQLKHDNGVIKEVKVGFSWTILFFCGFPFLFRGMPLWGLALFICSSLSWWTHIYFFVYVGGLPAIIMAFIGNKITATYYLEKGYYKVGAGWEIANIKWNMTGLPTKE